MNTFDSNIGNDGIYTGRFTSGNPNIDIIVQHRCDRTSKGGTVYYNIYMMRTNHWDGTTGGTLEYSVIGEDVEVKHETKSFSITRPLVWVELCNGNFSFSREAVLNGTYSLGFKSVDRTTGYNITAFNNPLTTTYVYYDAYAQMLDEPTVEIGNPRNNSFTYKVTLPNQVLNNRAQTCYLYFKLGENDNIDVPSKENYDNPPGVISIDPSKVTGNTISGSIKISSTTYVKARVIVTDLYSNNYYSHQDFATKVDYYAPPRWEQGAIDITYDSSPKPSTMFTVDWTGKCFCTDPNVEVSGYRVRFYRKKVGTDGWGDVIYCNECSAWPINLMSTKYTFRGKGVTKQLPSGPDIINVELPEPLAEDDSIMVTVHACGRIKGTDNYLWDNPSLPQRSTELRLGKDCFVWAYIQVSDGEYKWKKGVPFVYETDGWHEARDIFVFNPWGSIANPDWKRGKV